MLLCFVIALEIIIIPDDMERYIIMRIIEIIYAFIFIAIIIDTNIIVFIKNNTLFSVLFDIMNNIVDIIDEMESIITVSYTHLTLPTTERV